MIKCPKCGMNVAGRNKCPICGTSLINIEQPVPNPVTENVNKTENLNNTLSGTEAAKTPEPPETIVGKAVAEKIESEKIESKITVSPEMISDKSVNEEQAISNQQISAQPSSESQPPIPPQLFTDRIARAAAALEAADPSQIPSMARANSSGQKKKGASAKAALKKQPTAKPAQEKPVQDESAKDKPIQDKPAKGKTSDSKDLISGFPQMPALDESKKRLILIAGIAAVVIIIAVVLFSHRGSSSSSASGTASTGYNSASAEEKDTASENASNESSDVSSVGEASSSETENSSDNSTSASNNPDSAGENTQADAQTTGNAEDDSIHNYTIVTGEMNFYTAFYDAVSRGGYMARIESEAEFKAVTKALTEGGYTDYYIYLAGIRDTGSESYYWNDPQKGNLGDSVNASDSWTASYWYKDEPGFKDGDITEDVVGLRYIDGEWYFCDFSEDLAADYPGTCDGRTAYLFEYK